MTVNLGILILRRYLSFRSEALLSNGTGSDKLCDHHKLSVFHHIVDARQNIGVPKLLDRVKYLSDLASVL